MGWISEKLNSMISEAIYSFFADLMEQAVQWIAGAIVGIMSTAENVLNYPIVIQGILYSQGVAIIMLSIKVAFEAFQTWILYNSGDSNADPKGLLIGTVKAAAVIGTMPWLVRYLYLVGTAMAVDVSRLSGVQVERALEHFVLNAVVGGFFFVIICLISLVLIIAIFIQTFIRAAALGLLAVIGPVIAVQEVGGNSQLFSLWLKELVVVCFSQAIQIFLILAAMYTLSNTGIEDIIVSSAMLLGWLWVTVKAPSTIKQMMYSSGVGSAAAGAAQTAGTMLIVRKMMTKGV